MSARINATSIGCVANGSPDSLSCPSCFFTANLYAFSTTAQSAVGLYFFIAATKLSISLAITRHRLSDRLLLIGIRESNTVMCFNSPMPCQTNTKRYTPINLFTYGFPAHFRHAEVPLSAAHILRVFPAHLCRTGIPRSAAIAIRNIRRCSVFYYSPSAFLISFNIS